MKMKKHITKKIKKLAVSKMNSITALIVILSLLIIHIPLPAYAAEDEIMSAAENDTGTMEDDDTNITPEDTPDVTPENEQNPTPEEATEFSPQSVTEEELISGDFKYKETSSGATITGYTGNEDILTLPAMIDGRKVTSIGANAFYWCTFHELVIPETVQTVEANAFYATYLTKVTVNGKSTLFADDAFSNVQNITFVCSSGSKAYTYAREHQAKVLLTDGINLSGARVTLGKKSLVQGSSDTMKIPVAVTLNGKTLTEGTDYTCTWPTYREMNTVGTKTVTITAVPYNPGLYTGSTAVSYDVLPKPSANLRATGKITSSSIQLSWTAVDGVSGYILSRYDTKTKTFRKLATLSHPGSLTYTDKGLKKNTGYKYRIAAFQTVDGKTYYSPATERIAYTASDKTTVKSGKKVKMTSKTIKLKTKVLTENYNNNWAQVSAVSDFFDSKGRYTIAYENKKYVYISILNNTSLKVTKTFKIKKKYPLLGSVTGGPDGNYYIVWGQQSSKAGTIVLSVAKYNKNGKFVKSCDYYNMGDHADTATPFHAGNCAVTFQKDVLVCSYARQMNNVHQSNAVFCVNIKNMTENTDYDSYVSHSFDQRVIPLSNGDVLFADLGDAYPRSFSLHESGSAHEWQTTPFHFYGGLGDNTTHARLGGVGEVSTGIALAGTSAPSMTKKSGKEQQQLFIQIISPLTQKPVFKGSKRSGTSCGTSCTDTGIKWLTKYKNASVTASNLTVMENDRILVLWQKKDNRSESSWYMVLSPTGKVLQKATKIGNIQLNECEEIKYRKGCIFWTTADGKKSAKVHKLYIGKFK